MRRHLSALVGLGLVIPLLAALGASAPAQAVTPWVSLSVYPAPIGQTAGGYGNKTTYSGKVRPARTGAKVFLERRNGAGRWVVVSRTTQNRYGNYRGLYTAWPKAREALRVRSKPGRVNRLVASQVRYRTTWPMKFRDEFTGIRLNSTKWYTRFQPMHGSRPCSQPAANRVRVGQGVATLSVKRIAKWCAASPKYKGKGKFHNAMIGTREPFRYKHGVFAARVKFQAAQGMHGAFWLQGPTRTGAEIDIAEYFGAKSPEKLTILIHHTDRYGTVRTAGKRGSQLPTQRILGKRKTPANGYHVYAVHWNANRYQFFLDGQLMMTTNKPKVATSREELVLSLLTSDWEIRRLTTTNSVMKVDWVRVWQAK